MYENRRYVIFQVSELSKIDFSQVYETNSTSVRRSNDKMKTFVKYDLPQPSSVESLTTKSQEYTHAEMLTILATNEWTAIDLQQ
jgi:hypothetical protein